jgi:hypothetical protein
MAKKTCPTCGCVIASEGYETGGVVFCCEPCASGNEKKKPEKKPRRKCKK